MPKREFVKRLMEIAKEAEKNETCMSLNVSEEGQAVELLLDTSLDTYSEWIEGEGSDICLIRHQESGRVVGVRLPLLTLKLSVFHDGPIRINAGFRKGETP